MEKGTDVLPILTLPTSDIKRLIGALEELKFGFFTEMYFPEGD